jgi:hypothetical protein
MVRSARIGREVPMRYLGAVLMLVSLGCGDAKVPVEPSPPSVAPALQEFRLSGAVSDTANRPLAGSKVEVMDGSRTGTVGTTDEAGRFSMPGTFTELHRDDRLQRPVEFLCCEAERCPVLLDGTVSPRSTRGNVYLQPVWHWDRRRLRKHWERWNRGAAGRHDLPCVHRRRRSIVRPVWNHAAS